MATATAETKPKAAKAIVTSKLTADGVKNTLAKGIHDRMKRMSGDIALLAKVPEWKDKADAASKALTELINVTRPSE